MNQTQPLPLPKEIMIKARLEIAKQYLDDAILLFNQNRVNSAVSRAYYAAYQAMWSALGEPKGSDQVWKHLAIIKHFVRGYWFDPTYSNTGPGLLEDKRLPLRRLYSYRIKSDYDAVAVDKRTVKQLLELVEQVITLIEEKGGG